MSARAWLQAFRIHTASLTIPGTLLGIVLAGNTNPLVFLGFGAWALVFHAVGFLGNNLYDLSWDRDDPAKQHFPLVSGAVSTASAEVVYAVGLLTVALSGIALAALGAAHIRFDLALFFLACAVGFGVAYNRACKRSLWSPLFISASFASLPAFAYFASGGPIAPGPWAYVVLYGFAMMLCQIAWSGYYKDLLTDPVSLLRRFGVSAQTTETEGVLLYRVPPNAAIIGWTLRALCPLLAVFYAASWPVVVLAVAIPFAYLPLLSSGTSRRERQVLWMGVSEILTYWLLLLTLAPLLGGPFLLAAWALLPLAWYVAWNHALWKTALAPRV